MSEAKRTRKPEARLVILDETKELFESLYEKSGQGMTKKDFMHKLLTDCVQGGNIPEITQDHLPLGNEKERFFAGSTHEDVVKENLGFGKFQKVVMSERELLEKASEVSGKSVGEIEQSGRQYMAQRLITEAYSPKESRTDIKRETTFGKLNEAYKKLQEMAENGQYKPRNEYLSLTKVCSMAGGVNYNTALDWMRENNLQEVFNKA